MILYFRNRNMEQDRILNGKGATFTDKFFAHAAGLAGTSPLLWNTATRIGKTAISRFGASHPLVKAWTEKRSFPPLPEKTYRDIRNK
jgi:hypothetical protein